jgi:hypothetical protein
MWRLGCCNMASSWRHPSTLQVENSSYAANDTGCVCKHNRFVMEICSATVVYRFNECICAMIHCVFVLCEGLGFILCKGLGFVLCRS